MIKILVTLLILLFIGCSNSKKIKKNERYYQTKICAELKGEIEYVVQRGRVDCLTDEYAIEVDWASKFKQGIGQSLFYALKTGKRPAVVLIMGKKDNKYLEQLKLVAKKYNIKVMTIKKEPPL